MDSEQIPKNTNMQRQTAFKVRIGDILRGSYVKEEGWLPNYVTTPIGKVSRVNIIGIVVAIVEESSFKNILVDDGSGNISLRLFDNSFSDINLGEIVMVVGRPREFGGEKYIVPEIIRQVNQKWFEIRKIEIGSTKGADDSQRIEEAVQTQEVVETPTVSETPKDESMIEQTPVEKLISLIKLLDSGDGALFDDVSKKADLQNCEDYINRLLELGEIFEVKPGRFKVLE